MSFIYTYTINDLFTRCTIPLIEGNVPMCPMHLLRLSVQCTIDIMIKAPCSKHSITQVSNTKPCPWLLPRLYGSRAEGIGVCRLFGAKPLAERMLVYCQLCPKGNVYQTKKLYWEMSLNLLCTKWQPLCRDLTVLSWNISAARSVVWRGVFIFPMMIGQPSQTYFPLHTKKHWHIISRKIGNNIQIKWSSRVNVLKTLHHTMKLSMM